MIPILYRHAKVGFPFWFSPYTWKYKLQILNETTASHFLCLDVFLCSQTELEGRFIIRQPGLFRARILSVCNTLMFAAILDRLQVSCVSLYYLKGQFFLRRMHDILKENTPERITNAKKILQKEAAWWKLLSPLSVTRTMAERFCGSQMLTNLTFVFPLSQEPTQSTFLIPKHYQLSTEGFLRPHEMSWKTQTHSFLPIGIFMLLQTSS